MFLSFFLGAEEKPYGFELIKITHISPVCVQQLQGRPRVLGKLVLSGGRKAEKRRISSDFLIGKNPWKSNWCSHPENKGDLSLAVLAGNTTLLMLPAVEPCRSRRLLPPAFGLCWGELLTASQAGGLLCEVHSDLQGYGPAAGSSSSSPDSTGSSPRCWLLARCPVQSRAVAHVQT